MRFDWTTLALQTVNLLVLVWLLRRFLFRPVRDIIAQRRAATETVLAEAAAQCDAAKSEAQELSDRQRMLASETDHIRAEARAAAKAEQQEIVHQARDDAAKVEIVARTKLEQERAQSRRELEAEACQLAVAIATRLLARVPAEAISTALARSLDEWLAELPETDLRNLAGPDGMLEILTATPLTGEHQASCSSSLRRRLGDGVSLRFTVDPSLIAGIELRGPQARVHNNWRTDLDRIAAELRQDDRHLVVA